MIMSTTCLPPVFIYLNFYVLSSGDNFDEQIGKIMSLFPRRRAEKQQVIDLKLKILLQIIRHFQFYIILKF